MALTERYCSVAGAGAHDGTSEANAWTLSEAFAAAAAGQRVNVKAGTYTRTASDTLANAGSTAAPIIYRGYNATIGDLEPYARNAGGLGSLVTTNYPLIAYNATFTLTGTGGVLFEQLVITGNVSGAVVNLANLSAIATCSVTNASTNAAAVGIAGNTGTICWNCDGTLSGASGGSAAITASTASRIINCFVTGGPAHGILIGGANAVVIENFVFNCAGDGIRNTNTGTNTVYGNTCVNCGSDGYEVTGASANLQCFINNHVTDSGAWGLNSSGGTSNTFMAHNRTRDNTSGADTGFGDWATATRFANATLDSGAGPSDFLATSSQDYRLAGGAAGERAGSFKRNIGAAQRQIPAFARGG